MDEEELKKEDSFNDCLPYQGEAPKEETRYYYKPKEGVKENLWHYWDQSTF